MWIICSFLNNFLSKSFVSNGGTFQWTIKKAFQTLFVLRLLPPSCSTFSTRDPHSQEYIFTNCQFLNTKAQICTLKKYRYLEQQNPPLITITQNTYTGWHNWTILWLHCRTTYGQESPGWIWHNFRLRVEVWCKALLNWFRIFQLLWPKTKIMPIKFSENGVDSSF